MSNVNLSQDQVIFAARGGVELLSNKDLEVPLGLAESGALSLLRGLLTAIISKEVVLTNSSEEQVGDE